MQTKNTAGVVKSLDEHAGVVEAVYATLNHKDHDGDVILPGAFTEGEEVALSQYGHSVWGGSPPVGRGTIHTTGNEAVFRGQFFMDMHAARETFHAVRGMASKGEWSFGFKTLDSERGTHNGEPVNFIKKATVFEVSPVIKGAAGTGYTRTLSAKGYSGSGHHSPVPVPVHAETLKALGTAGMAEMRQIHGELIFQAWREREEMLDIKTRLIRAEFLAEQEAENAEYLRMLAQAWRYYS